MKKNVEKIYHSGKHLIPERLLYAPAYFKLKSVLNSSDQALKQRVLNDRLRQVLLTATQHVPAYQGLGLAQATVLNENPFELLGCFPYTEKDALMDEPQRYINRRASLVWAKYATSGGSTGRGVGVWRSKVSADIEKLFFDLRWGAFGYKGPKSRVLRIAAEGIKRHSQHPVSTLGRTLLLSPYHISKAHLPLILEGLARHRYDFIHAYAGVLVELTFLLQAACPSPAAPVTAIFLGSEPVTLAQLAILHRYWQCPLIAHYGLNERTSLGFYVYDPCDSEIAYTLEPLYGVTEHFPGSHELVGTGLWNHVMPIIRYRSKDYGTLSDGKIQHLDGREQNFLITRQGHKISGMSIVIDEATWAKVRSYQIRQRTPGKIELCIVPRTGQLDPAFKSFMLNQQLRRWGDFFEITLTECDSIPLTPAGKTRHVDVQRA